MEMLRLKSSGPAVRRVQGELRRFGFRIAEDGQFGHATDGAVRRFQRKRALVPDGIVGPATAHAPRRARRLSGRWHTRR